MLRRALFIIIYNINKLLILIAILLLPRHRNIKIIAIKYLGYVFITDIYNVFIVYSFMDKETREKFIRDCRKYSVELIDRKPHCYLLIKQK